VAKTSMLDLSRD